MTFSKAIEIADSMPLEEGYYYLMGCVEALGASLQTPDNAEWREGLNLDLAQKRLGDRLVRSAGELVLRETLYNAMYWDWNTYREPPEYKMIDTHVYRLRKKLPKDEVEIITIHGEGYIWRWLKNEEQRRCINMTRRFYVTKTWEDWPEGGSCGEIIEAETHEEAEQKMLSIMAEYRADEEFSADYYLEDYADDWHTVDCFDLDQFIAEQQRKNKPLAVLIKEGLEAMEERYARLNDKYEARHYNDEDREKAAKDLKEATNVAALYVSDAA